MNEPLKAFLIGSKGAWRRMLLIACFNHWRALRSALRGPQVLGIELTNRCNAACTMCHRERVGRPLTDMPQDWFERALDQAHKANIQTFQLSFFGEPLLHDALEERVMYIRERMPDAVIALNTNASLLTRERAKRLLGAGIDALSISIEGNNATEYERIRRGLSWYEVNRNVQDLWQLAQEQEHPVQIKIMGLHLADTPIDEAGYKAHWGRYAHKVVCREEHALVRQRPETRLERLAPCSKLVSQMILMADGRVCLCAHDWHGTQIVGDLRESTLSEIWHSPVLRRYRLLHLLGRKKSINFCKHCTYRTLPG